MQVGDLVKYKYNDRTGTNEQTGLVTSMDGYTVWWVDTNGYKSWTHRDNLKVVNASR